MNLGKRGLQANYYCLSLASVFLFCYDDAEEKESHAFFAILLYYRTKRRC